MIHFGRLGNLILILLLDHVVKSESCLIHQFISSLFAVYFLNLHEGILVSFEIFVMHGSNSDQQVFFMLMLGNLQLFFELLQFIPADFLVDFEGQFLPLELFELINGVFQLFGYLTVRLLEGGQSSRIVSVNL